MARLVCLVALLSAAAVAQKFEGHYEVEKCQVGDKGTATEHYLREDFNVDMVSDKEYTIVRDLEYYTDLADCKKKLTDKAAAKMTATQKLVPEKSLSYAKTVAELSSSSVTGTTSTDAFTTKFNGAAGCFCDVAKLPGAGWTKGTERTFEPSKCEDFPADDLKCPLFHFKRFTQTWFDGFNFKFGKEEKDRADAVKDTTTATTLLFIHRKQHKDCPAYKEDCKDMHTSCATWAAREQCDINPNYMMGNCGQSCCPICQDKQVQCPAKSDRAQCVENKDKRCEQWAYQGECRVGQNADWMIPNCMQSCCDTCRKTEFGCPVLRTDVKERDMCEDYPVGFVVADCDIWAKAGECTKNPAWMHQFCTKSCCPNCQPEQPASLPPTPKPTAKPTAAAVRYIQAAPAYNPYTTYSSGAYLGAGYGAGNGLPYFG